MKKIITLSFLVLFTNQVVSQRYSQVSYTSNVISPKLLILEDYPKSLHDSLTSKYFSSDLMKDSLVIIGILSFKDHGKTISIWKVKSINKISVFKFENDNGNIRIIDKNEYFDSISIGFEKVKLGVFKELIYANGTHKSVGFEMLKNKTRSSFGLLNISKLALEITKYKNNYLDILE